MKKAIALMFCLLFFIPIAFAGAVNNVSIYRSKIEPLIPALQVPKRVRLILPVGQKFDVMVFEEGSDETGIDLPEGVLQWTLYPAIRWRIEESSPLIGNREALIDENLNTSAGFDYDADEGIASVVLKSDRPITTSRLSLVLDENVAGPDAVEIFAMVNGVRRTVVARDNLAPYGWESYAFPRTVTDELHIRLWHSQPLWVRELRIDSVDQEVRQVKEEIIWLARPGKKYTVYFNAAVDPGVDTKKPGKLSGDEADIVNLVFAGSKDNERFVLPDWDRDGVSDVRDNCIWEENPDQLDVDNNGRGDVCEDFDRDEVINPIDNCPDHPNLDQQDEDGDGIGDACDREESRLTERLPWLPWAAMGLAAVVLLGLIVRTVRPKRSGG